MLFNKLRPMLMMGQREPFPMPCNPDSDHTVLMFCFGNLIYVGYAYHAALSFYHATDLRKQDFRIVTSNDWFGGLIKHLFPKTTVMYSTSDQFSALAQLRDKRRVTTLDADLFASGYHPTFFEDLAGTVLFCRSLTDPRSEINNRITTWNNPHFKTFESIESVLREEGATAMFEEGRPWYQAALSSFHVAALEPMFWRLVAEFSGKWQCDETVYNGYVHGMKVPVLEATDLWNVYYPCCKASTPAPWKPFDWQAGFQLAHPISGMGCLDDAETLIEFFRFLGNYDC